MGKERLSRGPVAMRRPRRSVLVLAGTAEVGDYVVRALAESLSQLDVETIYLGRESRAQRIASVVAHERADAIELCLAGAGGVPLLRELLRELIAIGRRDVSIVIHRISPVPHDLQG